jgi:hypothetical protein
MDKFINTANRARLTEIRNELFDIANSYVGDKHGHIACRLHGVSNSVHNIRDIMEVLYPLDNTPAESRYGREPDKVKPLAQYLTEYFEHELTNGSDYHSHRELLEEAFDAYESTEQVKIRIERI